MDVIKISFSAFVLTLITVLCAGCGSSDPVPPGQPGTSVVWSAWADRPDADGQEVVIPGHLTVILDESPPPLGRMLVEGALVFDRQDLQLTADSIMVHGGLYIGSNDDPFVHSAVITLTGARAADTETSHAGDRFLAVMRGGTLEIHGQENPSWTVLTSDAPAGSTHITVEDAAGWRAGDQVVVATTDYPRWEGQDPYDVQTEERTITEVSGNRLQLDRPLQYLHVGQVMHVAGVAVDQRAEVARLSRNIVIQGPESTLDPASPDHGFGGHVMVMPGGEARITGVEFRRMGQRGILARYPMHFHILRDGGHGSHVRSSAVHQSFNRCLTIHGTNGVLVQDVVGYGAPGHCFFLEDGAEMGNMFYGNLALSPRVPDDGYAILPSDSHPYFGPAGFWITHPDNVLIGNHAVGSPGIGFWYALPPEPVGEFHAWHGSQGISPRTAPLGVFRNNTAHSNHSTGLHVDNGFSHDPHIEGATSYTPRSDPHDYASEPVLAVFEDFDAWRNRDAGAWFRGDHTVLRGGILSDNPVGVTFASNASWADDVTFIGKTPNPGTPAHWEPTGANGESLPRPWSPDFVIRGFEFYDGDVAVRNSFFAAYAGDAVRGAAALSYKDYTDFETSPLNSVYGLTFAPGTERLRLATRQPEDGQPADGYRSAMFLDADGSVTGTAGTVVTVNNPFLATDSCRLDAGSGAMLCPAAARYASLSLQAVNAGVRALDDVRIVRTDGTSHLLKGTPGSSRYVTNLLLGHTYSYDFGPSVDHLMLYLRDISPGTSLYVSVPWTGSAPYIYRDWWIDSRNLLPAHASLAGLRASGQAGYFHDGSRLHLNLVQQRDHGYAQVEICRQAGC